VFSVRYALLAKRTVFGAVDGVFTSYLPMYRSSFVTYRQLNRVSNFREVPLNVS